MADISITCSQCGKTSTISEYATSETALCNSCSARLPMPKRQKSANGLRIREPNGNTGLALKEQPEPQEPIVPAPEPEGASTLANVYKVREQAKGPRALVGWLIFLALFLGLILMQQALADKAPILNLYNWVRATLGVVVYLSVILLAFEDGLGHGLVALLLPPYAFYYALARVELYWVRGMFLALFLALCAELYFIRDESAIFKAQEALNQVIRGGEGMIQRAGDAPTFDHDIKHFQNIPTAAKKKSKNR